MTADNLGLPEPFRVADFEGTVEEWLQRCRWQFEAIIDGHIRPWGLPVVSADDHDTAFWHVVTGDGAVARRQLDLERCASLGRVWDVLERLAADDCRVCWWPERRRGRSGSSWRRSISRL